MTTFLRDSPWPGMTMWALLYISDYALTITCARLYRAQDKYVVEGSVEITPMFQTDVDTLRRFSPRFAIALSLSLLLLWVVWFQTSRPHELPEAYEFVLGAMILLELAVHMRHMRNWFLFSRVILADRVRGRLEWPRAPMLRAAAFELWMFGLFYTIIFFVTRSWFILGGAVACAMTASSHSKLAQKHASQKGTSRLTTG
jgi:hypothetical protein